MCPRCVTSQGLCGRDDCRRQVLPQLARPNALLKLMGEARIEQTKRQNDQTLPVSPEHADHLKRKEQARNRTRSAARKHARAVARSQRRGNFGLAKAIMERTA